MSVIEYRDDYFQRALEYELKERGKKARLAIELGVTPPYITKISKGAEPISIKTQEKFSKGCGYTLEAFLKRGQRIKNGENPDSPKSNPETKTEVELESELETGEDGEMIDSQKKTISLLEKQVDSLEGDKKRMLATIEKLEAKVDKLEAKKERLEEKLEGIQGAMEHGQIQRPVNE